MTDLSKWDNRFIGLARHVAEWSKDPSTKVGAVVVGRSKGKVAFGYNGFPPGIKDTEERLNDRPTKYKLIQHAERNVLDNAHFGLQGATLYSTMFPCSECAKSIVSRGIRKLVCVGAPDREPWIEEVKWARIILSEGGVEVIETKG